MLKLLIADGGEEFSLALSDALRDTYQIRTCSGGREVLELMRNFSPDMVVLDMMLPGMDGISLLQQAAEEGMRPMVLATSSFFNAYVLESLEAMGVGYVMRKPCDVNATVKRLADLSQRVCTHVVSTPDPRNSISTALLNLGIPPRLKGYACIREAVLLMMRDPSQSVTKEIYPEVATRTGGNRAQIEHAIRSAIAKSWQKRDAAVWNVYFPPNRDGISECPTNKEFICRLADSIGMK